MKIFYYSGKGKKKTSVAKIRLFKGNGVIYSKQQYITYTSNIYRILVNFLNKKFNLEIFVRGGGTKSRINSIEFALSNALLKINPSYKRILKSMNLISDQRRNERKKIGYVKSRKKKQFSKR
ncbi:uS9 family ribosomal protein [Candidatus Vidania fulgoroideorum]